VPLVIENVCRFTAHGTIHDRPWANVIDMELQAFVFDERNDVIQDQARIIINEWADKWGGGVGAGWVFTGVSWVDLNSAEGNTGLRTNSPQRALPVAGSGGGETLAGAAALLVRKLGSSGRGVRPGRWYIPGVTESQVNGNVLISSFPANYQTRADDLLSGLNQTGGTILDYESHLVVVHTQDGLTGSFTRVNSLQVDSRLATQRRRLRG